MTEAKTCVHCGEVKSADCFWVRPAAKDGLHHTCKLCSSAINKAYRERNPNKIKSINKSRWLRDKEKIVEAKRVWRKQNPHKCKAQDQRRIQKIRNMNAEDKAAHLTRHAFAEKRRKYGTDGQAELRAQGGKCAICGTPLVLRKRGADIDHCHVSGLVRGVLCHHCNVAIGFMKDSPKLLRAAADYIESTGAFK